MQQLKVVQVLVGIILMGVFVECSGSGRKCQKISTPMCTNLGYNSTMKDGNQEEALLKLAPYEPFLKHTCSPHIRMFICSFFVPMCSEDVETPISACRGLCEKVQQDCLEALKAVNLSWPQELNCSKLPQPPELCMLHPIEEEHLPSKAFPNPELAMSNWKNCGPHMKLLGRRCVKLDKYRQLQEEALKLEICIGVFSIVCLVFTVFALLTFLIQPKRFRWPARPILYLTGCGFVTSTIYLIRWVEGPFTYEGDSQLEKHSESLSRVGISLILLFCDIAYSLWWCVFCFVWFLSAVKEWSTEAIEKISTRLHTSVWTLSAFPMVYILISNNLNNVSINYLSELYEVKKVPLIMYQLLFITISCFLSVLTSVALKNVRKTLLNAGRSPLKLERLFFRLLTISLGICLPHLLYLLCQFYDNQTMLKLVLKDCSIIFSSLWVYSPKTFQVWNNIIFAPFARKSEGDKKEGSIFSKLLPKVFQSKTNLAPKILKSNVPLMPVTKV